MLAPRYMENDKNVSKHTRSSMNAEAEACSDHSDRVNVRLFLLQLQPEGQRPERLTVYQKERVKMQLLHLLLRYYDPEILATVTEDGTMKWYSGSQNVWILVVKLQGIWALCVKGICQKPKRGVKDAVIQGKDVIVPKQEEAGVQVDVRKQLNLKDDTAIRQAINGKRRYVLVIVDVLLSPLYLDSLLAGPKDETPEFSGVVTSLLAKEGLDMLIGTTFVLTKAQNALIYLFLLTFCKSFFAIVWG
ncbi:hypothetical protein Tco_1329446 [Tanacetum coccineum]